MSLRLVRSRILFVFLFLLLAAAHTFGQSVGGTISGVVIDESGGMVGGATVRIVSADTGQRRVIGTTAEGNYEARELPPGRYTVTIEKSGFGPVSLKDVQLGVGQNARLQTITLKPAELDPQQVVVREEDAQVALVDPTTPTLSTSFGERQIRELPVINRDLNNLALLAPGVFSVRAFSFASTLVPFAANGSRGRDNNFIIDSVDNNEPLFGGAATQFTNSDLFAEYRILTNQYKAEYGRNTGSVVNIVTERGGNRWRGSLFWFGQTDEFNATNSVERVAQLDSSSLFYENQLGATLGGPIKSESSWVFASYQWDRARQDLSGIFPHVATLPTPNGLATLNSTPLINFLANIPSPTVNALLALPSVQNVANLLSSPCGQGGTNLPPTNPCTISRTFAPLTAPGVPVRSPGPDGMLFTADDVIVPVEFGTFLIPHASVFDIRDHQGSVRWDQRLSNRDNFYTRYLFDDLRTPVTGGSFPQEIAYSDLGLLPDYRTEFRQRTQNLGLFWTRAGARTLHELRGSYTRISSTTGALGVTQAQREDLPALTVGDPNQSFSFSQPLADGTAPGGTPQGTASLLAAFSSAGKNFTLGRDTRPRLLNTNIFQVQDNVSMSRDRHSIKFGVNLVRTQTNVREIPSDLGQFFYDTFNQFALDLPRFGFVRFPNYLGTGGDVLPLREFGHFYFFQDDFRATPNLVFSIGLRYENYGQVINSIKERNPFFGEKVGTDYNNLAPRLGFAWSPGKNTVVRGGYGVFYNSTPFVIPLLMWQSGPISPIVSLFGPFNEFPTKPWDITDLQLTFPFNDCTVSFANVPGSVAFNPVNCTAQDTVTRDLRQPYVQNYSLSVQQQMGRDWLFEVSYVGSKGTKLYQRLERNPQQGWDILAGVPVGNGISTVGCVQILLRLDPQCRLPRLQPGRGSITEVINGASSTYNAAQFTVTKRLNRPHGLAMTAAYTWSHMIDNASEIFGPNIRTLDLSAATAVSFVEAVTPFPQNPNDATRGERGDSAFDRRHRVAVSFLWALPSPGTGFSRFAFGNWQINGFATYQSGQPFSVLNGLRCGDVLGDGQPTNDRPDIGNPNGTTASVALLNNRLCLDPRDGVANPAIAALISANRVNPMVTADYITPGGTAVDPASVRYVQVGLGRIGSAGRNILTGPNLINMDVSVFKNFPFGSEDRQKNIQLRLEAYNVFNRANPGNPVGNVFTTNAQPVPAIAFTASTPSPARVTGTIPENSIDAFDASANNNAGQSLFLSQQFMNTSARRLQFAIKYIF